MRLAILDSGQAFGTKVLFALIRAISRQPVLDIINPAVKVTMAQVHITDPKPAHPAGDTTVAQKGTAP